MYVIKSFKRTKELSTWPYPTAYPVSADRVKSYQGDAPGWEPQL